MQLLPTSTIYVVGKMLANCLMQGGQPLVCFAHAIADNLVYDQVHSNAEKTFQTMKYSSSCYWYEAIMRIS